MKFLKIKQKEMPKKLERRKELYWNK